jgi:imidazolonepropionase-like amidohydrolase
MAGSEALSRRAALAGLGAGLMLPGLASAALPGDERPPLDGFAGPAQDFTLRNATLVLPDGQRRSGLGLRVEGGLIAEIGPLQSGTDMGGAWLVPGFTDAGCTIGLYGVDQESATHDQDEASDAQTPDARAWESYNPMAEVVPVARVAGISHALLLPVGARLVSGQAGLVQLAGHSRASAVVKAPLGLCLHLGKTGTSDKGPRTRMGVAMKLRELFEGIPEEPEEKKGWRHRKEDKAEEDKPPTSKDEVLKAMKAGRLPVLLLAQRADDLLYAAELVAEHKLKGVLVGGAEAHLVARELAAAGLPLLLGPVSTQPDSFDQRYARYDNTKQLHEAGLRFALRTGANHFARGLRHEAGLAVAHGLPWEVALAALSQRTGEIFGLPGLGRLEVGAPATFSRIAGDPLQPRHSFEAMWIGGRPCSMATRQTRLYARYRELR